MIILIYLGIKEFLSKSPDQSLSSEISEISIYPETFVDGVRDSIRLKEESASDWRIMENPSKNRERGESDFSVKADSTAVDPSTIDL